MTRTAMRETPHEPDSLDMPTIKLELLLTRAKQFGDPEKQDVQRQLDRAVERIERRYGSVFAMTCMEP